MTNQWDFESEIAAIIDFRDKRDWQRFHYPKDLAAAISIEAAELLELFLWKGQESTEQVQQDTERMSEIADEMADIAIYLFLLADGLDINMREAINRKIKKNAIKYPIEVTLRSASR